MYTSINEFKQYKKFKSNILEHLLSMDVFSTINEEAEIASETEEVRELLKDNVLETTPQEFYDSLIKSKHIKMLTPYSIDELSQMKLFKVPGYSIGYALKQQEDGLDIVSVHNNEPNVKGIGKDLIQSAIRNGGNMLDHFDIEPLNTIYSEAGFKEYARDHYDPQYDENGEFAKQYGEKDIIYRKL